MARFFLPLLFLCQSALFAQLDKVNIVPIVDPGDSWIQDQKNKFNFCYRENQGAIVDAKSNEIIDWIKFTDLIKKVTIDDDFVLVQTEFDGCLFNLKNFKAIYGPQFKGSAGAINAKKGEVYTAFENDLHLPMTAANILMQESQPRAYMNVLNLEGQMLDSIPILIRIPSQISFKGDKFEITGRMFYGGLCGQNRDVKNYAPFEMVDLKNRTTKLEQREIELTYEEELKLPKSENWYHVCTLEAWLHEPTNVIAVFGGGKEEGGAVKAFDLNAGEFLWGMSEHNDFIPIEGFNKYGDLFGYCWLEYDTLNAVTDYVAMDEIQKSSGEGLQYIMPLLKFDIQHKKRQILSRKDFDSLELDSANTQMIALEYGHFVDSLITDKYELYFNMNGSNFEVLLKASKKKIKCSFV